MTDCSGLAGFDDVVEIGRGGFGTVYRAVDVSLGRAVAVKVLSTNLGPGARERFAREGLAMGRLSDHPNVMPVYTVGVTTNGQPYLVMPFAARGSAAALLEIAGPIPWQESVRLTIRLAGALETAHRAGIVHRDIKPANILLSEYAEPLLTDFGIARVSGAFETAKGQISATLAHAAPEVLEGKPPSVASDLYSLGSTLFTLIDGRPPFESLDDGELASLCRRIACDAVPDLRTRGVPDKVCTVIERAMAKAPLDRPVNAAELGALLQDAQRAVGVAITEMAVAERDTPAVSATSAASIVTRRGPDAVSPHHLRGSGRRVLARVTGLLVSVVAAVIGPVRLVSGMERPVTTRPSVTTNTWNIRCPPIATVIRECASRSRS